MTRVTKDMFSHLRISQQFFRADTDDSRVDIAEGDRACKIVEFSFFGSNSLDTEQTEVVPFLRAFKKKKRYL